MKSKMFLLVVVLAVFFICGITYAEDTEEITLTTYYPAPYGEYDGLAANSMAVGRTYAIPAADNLVIEGNVGIGTRTPNIDLAIGDTDTGLQQQGDGELALYTNNVERVRIRNNGNVGIGTTNPGDKLDVAGSIRANVLYDRNNVGYYVDPASTSRLNYGVYDNLYSYGFMQSSIFYDRDNTGYYVDPASNTKLNTLSTGNITLTGDYLYRPGRLHIQATEILYLNPHGGTFVCVGGGGGNGHLVVTGNAWKTGGGHWEVWSDARLKKNVKPLNGALVEMLKLDGVTFQWKDPKKFNNMDGVYMGMVAQDVEKVFPEWVGLGPEGKYKTFSPIGFEALTVEAIRELKSENDVLKAKNLELEARIKSIEAKLK